MNIRHNCHPIRTQKPLDFVALERFGDSDPASVQSCFYGGLIREAARECGPIRQLNLHIRSVAGVFMNAYRLDRFAG